MKVDPEELLVDCAECNEEVNELEAIKHTFLIKGFPISFHSQCCPIYLGDQECKASHILYE